MRRAQQPSARLLRTASDQAGVLTRQQVQGDGITRHALARLSKGWTRVADGIYLTGEASWEAAAWAGLLRGGEGAVLSGAASAYLHGILRDAPSELEVWVPAQRDDIVVDQYHVRFRRGARSARGQLRRSSVEEAVLDLANRSDEDSTVAALTAALAGGKSVPSKMVAGLDARVRTRHAALIRDLCDSASDGIESALEWRFHHRVLVPHGLPIPERQVKKAAGRADTLYADELLIVELDGMRDHRDWSKDMMRDNEHAITEGLLTLRYGWGAVLDSACAVARQVGAALAARGWAGVVGACARCRKAGSSEGSSRD